jgi:hypothetical protein
MQIAFADEDGIRWTVTPRSATPSEESGNTTLVFTSESGERRTCTACLPHGGTWDDVEERVWCALLRYADVTPAARNADQ